MTKKILNRHGNIVRPLWKLVEKLKAQALDGLPLRGSSSFSRTTNPTRSNRASLIASIFLGLAGLALSACTLDTPRFDSDSRAHQAAMRLELGLGYFRLGQLVFAREELEKAVSIDPQSDAAFHALGLIAIEEDDHETALKHFQRAVQINPDNDTAVSDYAAILCHGGNTEEGFQVLEQNGKAALETERHLARLNSWGACSRAAGRPRDAERAYRRMLAQNPQLEQALVAMAELQLNNSNPLSARAFVERYFDAGHSSARALLLGAEVEQMLDNSALRDAYLQRLWQHHADSTQATMAREKFR